MMRLRTALFWAAAAALVIGHVVLAWHSLTVARFWEDEAFNLTVPRNLLAGLGYASDGALSGSTITPFDPRISTGPVVLLPVAALLATGMDPVLAGRLVPLAFWALLLAGLAVLGRRIGGRWAALLAVGVPLAFTAGAGVSPLQGPADLLGEIPAAALLVWALAVLPRRAWLAGLLVGLAVQAKLIAALALPAFAVALWVVADGHGWERIRGMLRNSWLPLLLAAVPTALFELGALLALGPAGFVDHLRAFVRFVRSGGQTDAATTVLDKLGTLAASWSLPPFVALLGAVLTLALVAFGVARRWRTATEEERVVIAYALAAVVGALAFVAWWATASRLPLWVRHPAPGILAFFPVLAAVAVWAVARLPERGAWRVGGTVAAALIGTIVATGAALHVADTVSSRGLTLAEQRADIEPLRAWVEENDIEWVAAERWGWAVPLVVLTGAHLGLQDAPSMTEAPRLALDDCGTATLAAGATSRLCAAR